jgi:hypothetical protein
VLRALSARPADAAAYGVPADRDELAAALAEALGVRPIVDDEGIGVEDVDERVAWAVGVAVYAHGWEVAAHHDSAVRLRPSRPLT